MSRKKTPKKTVGARSAITGQFVPKEELTDHPNETVAVTVDGELTSAEALKQAEKALDRYVDALEREAGE